MLQLSSLVETTSNQSHKSKNLSQPIQLLNSNHQEAKTSTSQRVVGNALSVRTITSREEKIATDARKRRLMKTPLESQSTWTQPNSKRNRKEKESNKMSQLLSRKKSKKRSSQTMVVAMTAQLDLLTNGLLLQIIEPKRSIRPWFSKTTKAMDGPAKGATTTTLDSEEHVISAIWANHTSRTTLNLNQCNNNGANSRPQRKIINHKWEIKLLTTCNSKYLASTNSSSQPCEDVRNSSVII